MIDILKGDWAAGEVKTFHVNGSYFEILECAYPVDVKLLDRQGAVLSDMRQAEASFFSDGQTFSTIQITTAQAQSIRSFYGDGTAGTRRTAGVVSVVDGGKARTLAGSAFMAFAYQSPAAGNLACVQLWNPPGSVNRVILESVMVSSQIAQGFNGANLTAALTTLAAGISKLSSGAAGSAMRGSQSVPSGTPLITGATAAFGGLLSAGGGFISKFIEPVVINPGYGFCLQGSSPNADMGATFEWVEEKI